jgi:O-antigen/teichoic acid export membrane protein
MSGMLVVRALPVVPEALIQRRFSFLRRVVVEPVSVLAFGIGAVIACANGLGPWGLVIGYYAAGVADAALSWALVQWRPKLNLVSLSMWRELVRYGRFVLASNVLLRAGGQIPVLVLGRFVSASALGQYRYAGRMTSTSLSLFVQSASYVLFPAFARIANDRVRYRAAALRSLRLLCALAFPFGALLIPLGVPAAVLLFGAVWEDAGFAAMALVGVPLGGTLAAFATEIFKADGRPSILTRLQAIGVVASAVAVLALLPLGLIGVAGGMSIGAVISGAYGLAKSRQLIGLTVGETVEAFIRPAIAAATMAILLTPVQFLLIDAGSHGTFAGLALLAAEAIVGLLIYAGSIRIIAAPVARDVWALVMKMLRRPSNRDATGQLVQPPM